MRAEIISIGTELLMGEITDTNATYLTSQLSIFGVQATYVTQVRDNLEELVGTLSLAWDRSDIVVATGGLGPTHDDLTREAIAQLFNENLYRDPDIENQIKDFLQIHSGSPVPTINLRQADIIPSAEPILNTAGTAPGLLVRSGEKILLAMPGVPHEMEKMWQTIAPTLLAHAKENSAIETKTIKTFGLSESFVSELIPKVLALKNPYTGIYAKSDGIHLRIISTDLNSLEAGKKLKQVEQQIYDSLNESIWGVDEDTPAGVLGATMARTGLTIATMESMTGGLIGSAITDIPGSSAYYAGGFVTYQNQMKQALGVPSEAIRTYGVVSPEVALLMAERTIDLTKADVGLAITGAAGPASADSSTPGTYYLGIKYKNNSTTIKGSFRSNRTNVKLRASTHAIIEVIRFLRSVETHID